MMSFSSLAQIRNAIQKFIRNINIVQTMERLCVQM